jgi:hypothetical protein
MFSETELPLFPILFFNSSGNLDVILISSNKGVNFFNKFVPTNPPPPKIVIVFFPSVEYCLKHFTFRIIFLQFLIVCLKTFL